MSVMWREDLITVEQELGFTYEINAPNRATHYQQVCPKCRRALFGLAQSVRWSASQPASEISS